jgi:hypothetical protein
MKNSADVPLEWSAKDRCISSDIKRVKLPVIKVTDAMRADDRVIGLELRPPRWNDE